MKLNFESLDYYFKNPFHDMKNLTEQNIAELRQAQEILNRVLPLMEPKEVEYKPFPEGYVIKKGTEVVCIDKGIILIGTKGKALESLMTLHCNFEGYHGQWIFKSHQLAPLNPEEHPNHPNFKLSAGDYVKIIQEGVRDEFKDKVTKLTESDLQDISEGYHFGFRGAYFSFPDQARFCTDAEIQEFEESLKPKPIPHGTLCLVSDDIETQNFVALFSDGKGEFYIEEKPGGSETFNHAIPFTPEMQQIVEDYITNN